MQLRISLADPGGRQVALAFPFDAALLAVVKAIPGRVWDSDRRLWLAPNTPETLIHLRDRKPAGVTLAIDPPVIERFKADVARLHAAKTARDAGDAEIEHHWITQPYAHQRAGLAHLVALGSGALLWEMGLGKTKTAIDYAEWLGIQEVRNLQPTEEYRDTFRALIVTPNTVARNWQNEIKLHAGHDDFVTLTGLPIAKRVALMGSARYTIVNCEALAYPAFAKAAQAREWDLVIVDESTRFKNPRAARTKALLKLGKKARHRLILTGTPITGSASDAWSQMEFVDPGLLGSFYSFTDQFLVKDWFGRPKEVRPDKVDELAQRIGRRSYRVLKRDVLDLPEKVYSDRLVEMADTQKAAYNQMRDELRVEIEAMEKVTAANVLTVLLRLTQITSGLVGAGESYTWIENNAKVAELDNLLNDELKGEQVVIFGLYQKELENLASRYALDTAALGPAFAPIIYGPTPEVRRHALIEQFQAGDRRLLFAQIRTGGIGINLTAAQTAVYYSRSWSLEEWLQSQDRLHRIGQKGTVSIVSLIAKGTVDEQIGEALMEKQKLADSLTGDGARKLIASVLGGR